MSRGLGDVYKRQLVFGMLEVFSCSTNLVTQRYTARDSPFDVYIRSKVNSSWSKWVKK